MIARNTLINTRFTTTFGDVFVAKQTRPDISEPSIPTFFVTESQGAITPAIFFTDASLADWDFGDGTIVLGDNSPSHTYTDGQPSHEVRLPGVDLSKVDHIRIGGDKITDVDLSIMPNLMIINCDFNRLTSLDISGLNLRKLECINNNLSVLDVSAHTNLEILRCGNNNISVLDVSALVNINRLNCINNNISVLDISGMVLAMGIDCDNNNISVLDVSNLVNLDYLTFKNNNLGSGQLDQIIIDLDNNGQLNGVLNYSNNPGAPTLASLTAYNNLISKGWTITGPVPA